MRILQVVCSAFLFFALADMPIGFYTFLRIVVTIGAIATICDEVEKGITIWVIIFGLIAILFNPIIPIHLYQKSAWVPLDIIGGSIFLLKAFFFNTKLKT